MRLLERQDELARLVALIDAARVGRGHVAVVAGEAGIGKTALLKRFIKTVGAEAAVLSGMCDDLYTPQVLAPFYDIALQVGDGLGDLLLKAASPRLIVRHLLQALEKSPGPTVVIVEDIHWADEATLDVLHLLGRRIARLPVLLVLTMRDSDAPSTKKPRALLGSLPATTTDRIRLAPLTVDAIRALIDGHARLNADDVLRLTGGNPFYVTEIIAAADDPLPLSVRDAVLARARRLSESARHVLEAVSIVPNHAETWLIDAVVAESTAALDEVLESGMLVLEDGFVSFRHELARRAVVETLPPMVARTLHRAALDALVASRRPGVALSRLVHHANHGDVPESVLEFAPRAAREASAASAHREAASHYASALQHAEFMTPEGRVELLQARADACYWGVHWETAIGIYEQALELRRGLDHQEQVGDILRRLSRLTWGMARVRQSRQYAVAAVRTLRRLKPGKPLAMAYSVLGQWHMHQNDVARTIYWSEKAIDAGNALREFEPQVDALTNIGTALAKGRAPAPGIVQLEQSLRLALAHGLSDQACRAYFNLVSIRIEQEPLDRAQALLDEAFEFATERDLNTYRAAMMALSARIAFFRGQWRQTEALAEQVIQALSFGVAPLMCEGMLVCIAVRQGARDATERVATLRHGKQEHLQLPGDAELLRLTCAEAAWLRGDNATGVAEAEALLALLRRADAQWTRSWATYWRWRCGGGIDGAEQLIEPHRLQVAGDWRGAAEAWQARGFAYEAAMALADGNEDALRTAFSRLDQLGAHAATDYIRKRLRELGSESVPRGVNTATRNNPVGLTMRQMNVLALLAEGLTNQQVAARLHITPKTVGHHVSAILAKLDVSSRESAVRTARALELID